MDTYSAVPTFQRLPIRVIDRSKYDEWLNSDIEKNVPIPTIVEIFIGFEQGVGCPVPVAIEVDKVQTEYYQQVPTETDRAELDTYQYVEKWRRVRMLLRRNLLLAVIRNLDPDDANNLASEDEGPGFKILVRLGWLEDRTLDSTPVEDETDTNMENKEEGEVVAVDETGS